MKRVATPDNPEYLGIPLVVGIAVVRVQPGLAVVVALDVEQVQVAVRIGFVQDAVWYTAHRILSGLNLIRDLKSQSILHQVSSFFECSHESHYPQP